MHARGTCRDRTYPGSPVASWRCSRGHSVFSPSWIGSFLGRCEARKLLLCWNAESRGSFITVQGPRFVWAEVLAGCLSAVLGVLTIGLLTLPMKLHGCYSGVRHLRRGLFKFARNRPAVYVLKNGACTSTHALQGPWAPPFACGQHEATQVQVEPTLVIIDLRAKLTVSMETSAAKSRWWTLSVDRFWGYLRSSALTPKSTACFNSLKLSWGSFLSHVRKIPWNSWLNCWASQTLTVLEVIWSY